MVLGLRTKNRRSSSVQVDYLIHIQEIKPWPPSQSLRSLRSVLIQWENGDRSSGSTNSVTPSIGSVVGEGRIEFNESFRLPMTLFREVPTKAGDADTFQKNCLELNLYEPRRDKTVKGQLLGTAIVDLAEYGVIREALSVNVPMNCKRSFRNTDQPILSMKIQRVDRGRTSSSSRGSLSKEVSLDKNGGESVSALMNEEYAEEAEIASFTDDDVSSHSSQTISSSVLESNGDLPSQNEEKESERMISTGVDGKEALPSKVVSNSSGTMPHIAPHENPKGSSSCSSSVDVSSDPGSPVNGHASTYDSPNSSSNSLVKNDVTDITASSLSLVYENREEEPDASMRSSDLKDFAQKVHEKVANGGSAVGFVFEQNSDQRTSNNLSARIAPAEKNPHVVETLGSANSGDLKVNGENGEKAWTISRSCLEEATTADDDNYDSFAKDKDGKKQQENGQERQNLEEKNQYMEDEPVNNFSQDATRKQESLGSDTHSTSRGNLGMKGIVLKSDRLKHVKSVRSPVETARSNGLVSSNQHEEVKEVSAVGHAHDGQGRLSSIERKDAKVYLKDTRNAILDGKVQQLERRIKMLEGELREAAAIEAALYSVAAEHGSSMSKVHAPARRLSRLYLYACRENSEARRASAARSAVSGLVLVAKACGNDVPRLTFWLSNSVVLRAIISQAIGDSELPLSVGPRNSGSGKGIRGISSSLKWKESSPSKKGGKSNMFSSDWDDPHIFISGLEKIEGWIFSRIVESIWWQTLTPHMQSAAAKAIDSGVGSTSKKNYGRTSSSIDQEQGNFSLDLWKKAFKDACERLCPLRAGGHECGCLPVITKLIMEQCVARLDVAMFNAILRESADEIPTDPVSDPISDSKVLPIPAGKTSFGAGAQLKVAIGNWSRWLTDLFGIDDDDPLEEENDHDHRQDSSFKSFHLLNALSDLMMLPKDMLLSRSIRKEVCPAFGAPLIKRVIDNFVPDEFCPDPIPDVVFEALDSEDPLGAGGEYVASFPCAAAPTVYSPPSAASVAGFIGEVGSSNQLRRSGSSVLRKSYTSDDELDELNLPLASIFIDGSQSSPHPKKTCWVSKENETKNAIRYQLLRDVWLNGE